jgi:hypothetical protein
MGCATEDGPKEDGPKYVAALGLISRSLRASREKEIGSREMEK